MNMLYSRRGPDKMMNVEGKGQVAKRVETVAASAGTGKIVKFMFEVDLLGGL